MAKLERKPAESVALAGLIVQLLAGVVAYVFSRISGACCVKVLFWQALIGVPVWLMALVQLRHSRLADEETSEWERLAAERAAGGARETLFEADEIQAFAARNRLRFLERFLQPALSCVLAVCLGLVVTLLFVTDVLPESRIRQPNVLLSVAFLGAMTFVLFLIANYAAGMARQAVWRSLRAGAGFMMLTTLFGAVSVVALMLGLRFYKPDLYIAWGMLIVMGILGAEILINFVLDFYRPRVEGVETRPSFDSRLLGLMSEPTSILKTVAATLDYQFGFKVSQTWFYHFSEQMVAPFILFLILALYGLTCFEIVKPEERGVLERFGKFKRVVGPGLAAKWPWPVDRVYRFRATNVKTLVLGHAGARTIKEKIVWTEKHYEKEFETMVAAERVAEGDENVPVNLIVASARVRYRLKDTPEAIRSWYYECSDPEELIRSLCSREQQQFLAGVDFYDVMGVGRLKASETLRARMQAAVDEQNLGIEIVGVGLEEIHPPIEEDLPAAFHQVVEAIEKKEVTILEAATKAIKKMSDARAEADEKQKDAHQYYADKAHVEKAKAEQFKVQCEIYKDILDVFRARKFLSAVEEKLGGARKLIVGAKGFNLQHLRLNLQDPAGAGLGDIEFDEVKVSGEESKKK